MTRNANGFSEALLRAESTPLRQARVQDLWRRFCAGIEAGLAACDLPLRFWTTVEERLYLMRLYKHRGQADWLRPLSAIEEADLMAEGAFEPRPASRPAPCRPGTRQKIELLAARCAAGEELWHAEDEGTY